MDCFTLTAFKIFSSAVLTKILGLAEKIEKIKNVFAATLLVILHALTTIWSRQF